MISYKYVQNIRKTLWKKFLTCLWLDTRLICITVCLSITRLSPTKFSKLLLKKPFWLSLFLSVILYISFKHNVIDGLIQRQVGSLQRQVAFFLFIIKPFLLIRSDLPHFLSCRYKLITDKKKWIYSDLSWFSLIKTSLQILIFFQNWGDLNGIWAIFAPPGIHTTGLYVKKVYTSLGTSCHNAYTKFFCWLLEHICILIAISPICVHQMYALSV